MTEQGGVTLTGPDGATCAALAGPVTLPHPILLDDIDQWRTLSDGLGAVQGVPQLDRSIHHRQYLDAARVDTRRNCPRIPGTTCAFNDAVSFVLTSRSAMVSARHRFEPNIPHRRMSL